MNTFIADGSIFGSGMLSATSETATAIALRILGAFGCGIAVTALLAGLVGYSA